MNRLNHKTHYLFIECNKLFLGHYFTEVGDSGIRYGNEELFYHSAKRRCHEVYEATLLEFRNEHEWTEVK